MSLRRRAGAPRLIEWTGERCVPWAPDVQVVYEHLHRYLWAAGLVRGRRVLDLGSGEGFGASILADSASEVVGVDLDERTVEHARLNWSSAAVSFVQGSALDLSRFEDGSFGAVVAFEVIEHIEQQETMLAEVARVLADDGILIVSTPDRRIYSESTGQNNPFHERELSYEEFSSLLDQFFANLSVWGQRTITGSHLGALESGSVVTSSPASEFFIERAGEEWRLAGDPAGLYLVAVASNGVLPPAPANSTLGDCDLELLRAKELDAAKAAGVLVTQRDEAQERERQGSLASASELKHRKEQLAQRDEQLVQRDEYIRHRNAEITAARARLRDADASIADLEGRLAEVRQAHLRVEESVTWQAFQRLRGRLFSSIGEGSVAVRLLRSMLRLGGRAMSGRGKTSGPVLETEMIPSGGEPIHFPTFAHPTASLVIPLYSAAALTRRCLETIRDHTDQVAYEVILVDDTADEETKRLLDVVTGARVVVNEQNLGYLRSVNLGASFARGEWLVLCNNDIEVTPVWLQAMLVCGESGEDIGVIAPKFVSPDGRLSEAGAVLWSDGTGVNYGRGDDPTKCQYEYTREVDYGSAAALMVRAKLWHELGGFDERYIPMYYEDADLCFEARQHGWRVLYEPSAVVMHVEGGTAGVDQAVGHKRNQATNRLKFVEKWRTVLESEHLRPGDERVRAAANRHRGPEVLVVDFRVPMRDRDAGSLRMFEMIGSLLRLGYGVKFLPDNLVPIQPYTRDLQRLGIEVMYGSLDLNHEFAEIGPGLQAAILSRPHSASRWLDSVCEFAPSATVIYDTVDLHWIRESRRFALGKGDTAERDGAIAVQGPKAAALRELELALVRASDITITVTADERKVLEAQVPEANVAVIPTIHNIAPRVTPVDQRKGLLFVGGFEHPPNADAAVYLIREVMPLVWNLLGDVSVTIIGSSVPPEVEKLASSRVDVRGWVEDLEPLLQSARALVAPVRFGAGVKGKITQGLAAGLPVVTTPVGAEGLGGSDGENMLIGGDTDALAERIVRVVEDDVLWGSLSRGGQELIAGGFSLDVLDERMRELLDHRVLGHPIASGG